MKYAIITAVMLAGGAFDRSLPKVIFIDPVADHKALSANYHEKTPRPFYIDRWGRPKDYIRVRMLLQDISQYPADMLCPELDYTKYYILGKNVDYIYKINNMVVKYRFVCQVYNKESHSYDSMWYTFRSK